MSSQIKHDLDLLSELEKGGTVSQLALSKRVGIAVGLLFQVFVNVGMNLGIMPITGIPLPLMSYGGSSVLATFLAVGVLQSINIQARLSQRDRFAW